MPKFAFKPTVILHGGAGNIKRSHLPPDPYQKFRRSMLTSLRSTYYLLNGEHDGTDENGTKNSGCSALDAAVHAVSLMEDDPLFNCGRGSVFTTAGTIEMEASVMVCSVTPDHHPPDISIAKIKRGAGVMMVKNVRHPIQLAKEVLLRTGDAKGHENGGSMHSQLCGPYVEKLARDWGLEFKPDEWFWTEKRWKEHLDGLKKPRLGALIDQDAGIYLSQGTVGAVCLDQWGNIAVATSTGGLTNKLPGRIGDTPTLGAGFWAEDWDTKCDLPYCRRAAAVSGTGNGDSFLRTVAARTAVARARFSPAVVLAHAVTEMCGPDGELQQSAGDRWGHTGEGVGGMIGIEIYCVRPDLFPHSPSEEKSDTRLFAGRIAFDFNGTGMFRAWMEQGPDGEDREVMMVFRDEYK
ncbi:hypothetical protein LOZ66_006328 [Ophidiomyces ophidiicola]|nr:hypothetical protein LOZ66_006328 [Ophidiomyces ophidiicola]